MSGAVQLASFLGVGATSALAYIGLSIILTLFGIDPWVASVASYCIMIVPAYLAQRTLTFRSGNPRWSSLPKYVTTQLIGLTLAGLLPYYLGSEGTVSSAHVFAIVALTVAVINFALLKLWAFR